MNLRGFCMLVLSLMTGSHSSFFFAVTGSRGQELWAGSASPADTWAEQSDSKIGNVKLEACADLYIYMCSQDACSDSGECCAFSKIRGCSCELIFSHAAWSLRFGSKSRRSDASALQFLLCASSNAAWRCSWSMLARAASGNVAAHSSMPRILSSSSCSYVCPYWAASWVLVRPVSWNLILSLYIWLLTVNFLFSAEAR